MADEVNLRDANRIPVVAAVTNDADQDITMLRIDATTKRVLMDALLASGSTVGHNITGMFDGRTTIAVLGTPQHLGVATCKKVMIAPLQSNASSFVVVGASSVLAATASLRGVPVYKGNILPLECDNLSDVWVDVGANNDGVSFIGFT